MDIFKRKPIEFDMVTTKGGDSGRTSLYSGEFLFKSESVFDVMGELDLLSSEMGYDVPIEFVEVMEEIQRHLYYMMSIVATSSNSDNYPTVNDKTVPVEYLERLMKRLMRGIDIKPHFVLPSSRLDILRARTRNAERVLIKYVQDIKKSISVDYGDLHHCQRYLNRLSDLFFVMARWEEQNIRDNGETKFNAEIEEID